MSQHLEVVTDPPAEREPRPDYVAWRNRAFACLAVFLLAVHSLVWFSTWSDKDGNSFMEVCGIWIVVSGAAGIGCAIAYADAKDNHKRAARNSGGRRDYY